MKTKVLFSVLFLLITGSISSRAQLISGDIFLQGKYIEAGVAMNGALGSGRPSPASYHSLFMGKSPSLLGIVADPNKDGWTVGHPAQIGDYFLPGTPLEGWDIQINGFSARASRAYGDSSFTYGLSGNNTAYTTSGNLRIAEWNGAVGDLKIQQTTTIDVNQLYILFNVKLKNTGPVSMSKIYYNRAIDPDNEMEQSGKGFPTHMHIEKQIPDPNHQVLVSARGDDYGAYLSLGAQDCRAKAYFLNSGLIVTNSLDSLYQGNGPGLSYFYSKTDSIFLDVGMGVVFSLGNLNPGDSTILSYAYVLDKDNRVALMNKIFAGTWNYKGMSYANKDTVTACEGDLIQVGIAAPGYSNWIWAASPNLSDTMGQGNFIKAVAGTYTYTASRNYAPSCGSGHDTMRITVKALPVSKPALTKAGTTLSIPALYSEYTWYRNDVAIPSSNKPDYTMLTNGRYYVKVLNENACISYSDTLNETGLGVGSLALNDQIRIYPNPTSDKVFIDAPFAVTVTLTDISGRTLLEKKNVQGIDLSAYADGVYLISVRDGQDVVQGIQKIMKQSKK